MADDELRRIERLGEDAPPADQARLLAARMRLGELGESAVRLAAEIGHPGARLLLSGFKLPEESALVGAVLRKIGDLGREACVRAAVALGRKILADYETLSRERAAPLKAALTAAGRALERPSLEAGVTADTAAQWALGAGLGEDQDTHDNDYDDYGPGETLEDELSGGRAPPHLAPEEDDPYAWMMDDGEEPHGFEEDEGRVRTLEHAMSRIDVEHDAPHDSEVPAGPGEHLRIVRVKDDTPPDWHDRTIALGSKAVQVCVGAARIAASAEPGTALRGLRVTNDDLDGLLDSFVPWLLGPGALLAPEQPWHELPRRVREAPVVDGLSDPVRAALATLEEEDRAVLLLRTVQGLPMSEVAQTLGISRAAAETRLERAMEELRSRLESV